jgi:hypothetical protein
VIVSRPDRVDVSTATTRAPRAVAAATVRATIPNHSWYPRAKITVVAAEREDHHIRECDEFHRGPDEVGIVRGCSGVPKRHVRVHLHNSARSLTVLE